MALLVLMEELSSEMSEDEIAEFDKKIDAINVLLNNRNKRVNGWSGEIITSLHRLSIDLRKILKSSGLLIKMKEDPRMTLK